MVWYVDFVLGSVGLVCFIGGCVLCNVSVCLLLGSYVVGYCLVFVFIMVVCGCCRSVWWIFCYLDIVYLGGVLVVGLVCCFLVVILVVLRC